tara:strand:+ start:8974 stop:9795 length:822 start_codon:yes stop_codon:yes gene_type:complete
MTAFLNSCRTAGITPVENGLDCDAVVIWSILWNGRMSKNKRTYEHYRSLGKPVLIIDVGAIEREVTWKIAVNNITSEGYYGHTDNLDWDRPKKLGVSLQKNNLNDNILIAAQHKKSLQWEGMPSLEDWTVGLIHKIRKYSDRHIVVRYHPRCPYFIPSQRFKMLIMNKVISNCVLETPMQIESTYDAFNIDYSYHAVVNHCSGPGINAVIAGSNVSVDQKSLAYPMSIKLKQIENPPRKKNKEKWLVEISHTEYTVDEINNGQWLTRLKNALE